MKLLIQCMISNRSPDVQYANAPEIRVIEKSQPKKHTCFVLEISPQTPEGQLLFEIGLLQGIDEIIVLEA